MVNILYLLTRYMKTRTKIFAQDSFDDLEDNLGIVMPILTECDVDEDFTEGIDKIGKVIPILPLRNMVLFPGVAMPVIIGRPKSMRLIKDAVKKKSLIGVVCQKEMNTEDPLVEDLFFCWCCGGYRQGSRNAGWYDYRYFTG